MYSHIIRVGFLVLKAGLMPFALVEICAVGSQIYAADHSNPELFPPRSASHSSLSIFVNVWKRLTEARH